MEDSFEVTFDSLVDFDFEKNKKVTDNIGFYQSLNFINWCNANVYFYKYVLVDDIIKTELLEFEDHGGTDNVIVFIDINYIGPKYADEMEYTMEKTNEDFGEDISQDEIREKINQDLFEKDKEKIIDKEYFLSIKNSIKFPINSKTIRIYDHNDNSIYYYNEQKFKNIKPIINN